ncbi:MAG: GNAT family N-acetyltransferase [Roseovarius sp.]
MREDDSVITLRAPLPEELPAASALCLRSKAHWGYDAAFMAACVEELTLTEDELLTTKVTLAFADGALAGVAQVSNSEAGCFLEKLFVEPAHMGRGLGRVLFRWSCEAARELGASEMIVEADPDAEAFYCAMGCTPAGSAPSGSIPGRVLPRLLHDLRPVA